MLLHLLLHLLPGARLRLLRRAYLLHVQLCEEGPVWSSLRQLLEVLPIQVKRSSHARQPIDREDEVRAGVEEREAVPDVLPGGVRGKHPIVLGVDPEPGLLRRGERQQGR